MLMEVIAGQLRLLIVVLELFMSVLGPHFIVENDLCLVLRRPCLIAGLLTDIFVNFVKALTLTNREPVTGVILGIHMIDVVCFEVGWKLFEDQDVTRRIDSATSSNNHPS